jgi:hypothetical protein
MLFRILAGIAAAALGATVALVLPGFSPDVAASIPSPHVGAGIASATGKADRLPERLVGTACSEKAWPYFEADCLRDRTPTANLTRTIRLISPERQARR